ncbi:Protein Y57G11C.45 b [Aphelenchoides avenae]|nr:Protein Y57G11C.45 b [Aphelenchus avenae]
MIHLLASHTYGAISLQSFASFPYSVTFLRMLRPPYAGSSRSDIALSPRGPEVDAEISNLVDEIDGMRTRKRRSNASMSKRYACRFKFCRIYDQ